MTSPFEQQLDKLPPIPASPTMPLTHITDWACFLKIAISWNLKCGKPCDVYGEELIYTFYGRPAYRKKGDDTYSAITFSPVCFILKPELMDNSKRIVPFDSGGFGLYGPAMHPSLTKESFELSPQALSAMHVAGTFWSTNAHYYSNGPLSAVKIPNSSPELIHYDQLISNKLAAKFDDRASTIEVQFLSPLLLKGNVSALIVPSNVVDEELRDKAKELGADLLPYEFFSPFHANDFAMPIRSVVKDYLATGGVI